MHFFRSGCEFDLTWILLLSLQNFAINQKKTSQKEIQGSRKIALQFILLVGQTNIGGPQAIFLQINLDLCHRLKCTLMTAFAIL